MRALLTGGLAALGLGLIGTSSALTAPVNGAVINELAATESIVEDVARKLRSRRICIRWKVTRHHSIATRWYTRRGCLLWRHF